MIIIIIICMMLIIIIICCWLPQCTELALLDITLEHLEPYLTDLAMQEGLGFPEVAVLHKEAKAARAVYLADMGAAVGVVNSSEAYTPVS